MRSRSKSRPSDYIQSGNRITRAKNKEIASTIQTKVIKDVDLCKALEVQNKNGNRHSSEIFSSMVKHYEEKYLNNEEYAYLTMNIRNVDNKHKLMKLYKMVTDKGGFKEVTANNEWNKINDSLYMGSNEQAFEVYKKYLFHYEKIFNESTKLRLTLKDDNIELVDLDPNYLIMPTIFEVKSADDINPELISKVLQEDVCVIRNFEKAVGFNKDLFDPKKLIKTYPNALIDVVTQDPDVKTFHRTKHEKDRIKLIDYLNYQKQEDVKDGDGNIKFGVNLDIGTWGPQIDELVSKIPEDFLFCSERDILQYVRQHILGMTQPQMYIKVKGAWTGGHEENLRYRAVNLNHGPGSSEWN